MSFLVLQPSSLGEQGLWPRAGAAPGTRVAKGWRTRCRPEGAASGDFTPLTVVFLNVRGRKNSCGESRGGRLQHSCPPFQGGRREEKTLGGLVAHTSPAGLRTWKPYPSIHALTLLKQSWSSLVWDQIQSVAVWFLEITPVLVISAATFSCHPAQLLLTGLCSSHTVFSFLQTLIASTPAIAVPQAGVWVGEPTSDGNVGG